MQECIATIRESTAKIEELRSRLTSLGKQDLLDRKEQIKKLAREHRDDGTLENTELEEKIAEVESLNEQIAEIVKQEEEIINEIKAEEQKQKTLEQYQNDAVKQTKANEDAMKKNEVERNIDELGDYIDMLGESIQKKELPKAQIVSELSKMLDSILNNKSYISKESFNKIRNDNEVFIKHILKKCPELENFSGTFLETRMQQVNAKFNNILG